MRVHEYKVVQASDGFRIEYSRFDDGKVTQEFSMLSNISGEENARKHMSTLAAYHQSLLNDQVAAGQG